MLAIKLIIFSQQLFHTVRLSKKDAINIFSHTKYYIRFTQIFYAKIATQK